MVGSNQESYWRIYLLLNEGCPLIFKQLIAREIEKCGGDLDSLLRDHKAKLCEDLSPLDVNILFPESQKTDVDNWNSDIFPCVILTLFGKTLQQVEKQGIKRIQNVLDDIEDLPAMSLDYDAYDDLEQTLSKTLHKLAYVVSNAMELVTKIDELLQMFLKQPLNVVDLLGNIRTFNMQNKTRQKLRVFLEAHTKTENTIEITSDAQTSVKEEKGSLDEYGSSRKSANVSVETQIDLDEAGKLEEATRGSDEIRSDRKDITTKENAIRSKVQNVEGDLIEQEAERTKLLFQGDDFGENLSAKRFDDTASDKLDDFENITVKVAVLGRTGVGKSKFINVVRGCKSKTDPFYAKVGSVETTIRPECYPHPKNKQLLFYDLPGIGTDKFKRETFLDDSSINFYSYDIYIIMASDRFTTDESFFAESLIRSGKKFLFVRTRVDINLEDADDEQAEINKIRDDCEKNLRGLSIKENDVFLISSKHLDHKLLDFDRLVVRLVYSLSGLKKDAMIFSMHFNTKEIIDCKEKALESRIPFIRVQSAVAGAIPLRGASQLFDFVSVKREIGFYRKTLGVTENNLKDLAEITKTNVEDLKRLYELKSFKVRDDTKTGLRLADIFKWHALEEVPNCTGTTESTLRSNLKILVEDARKMMDILVKVTGKKISGI